MKVLAFVGTLMAGVVALGGTQDHNTMEPTPVDTLSDAQLAAVVEYLLSLRGEVEVDSASVKYKSGHAEAAPPVDLAGLAVGTRTNWNRCNTVIITMAEDP